MATRSPTPFHSFWGSHPTVSLPSSEVEVGDTAYDTTLYKLVVCTSVGPVVWTVVGDGQGVTSVTASSPLASSGGTTPNVSLTGVVPVANGGTNLSTAPTNGQLLIGNGTDYTQAALTAGSGISITNGSGTITIAASASGKDLSFQGEVTGTTPLVIGAVYLTSGTLLLGASSALLGTVSGGKATLRLVRQSTGAMLTSWEVTGALASTTLGGNVNVAASDWYVFDLAGSAAGTVSRAYGARLEV